MNPNTLFSKTTCEPNVYYNDVFAVDTTSFSGLAVFKASSNKKAVAAVSVEVAVVEVSVCSVAAYKSVMSKAVAAAVVGSEYTKQSVKAHMLRLEESLKEVYAYCRV